MLFFLELEFKYSKASRYTASTYTDFTDTRFLIGSRNIQGTLILSLFFTDTRFFTSGKIKIIEFSLLKSEFVHLLTVQLLLQSHSTLHLLHIYYKKGTSLNTDLAHLL